MPRAFFGRDGECFENALTQRGLTLTMEDGARRRFPASRLSRVRGILWQSGLPVAWIRETGRCVTGINERALVRRWPGVPRQRPLSLLLVYTV